MFSGISTIGATEVLSEDVAWWAHIGGFAFGMICGLIYRPLVYLRR
ncbi:MAG: rhomboid family intramembrane serine protease [Chitinophagales bacterium]|nr:rhomboid family intramembrane serine protease [Chitinophagales bacterium]